MSLIGKLEQLNLSLVLQGIETFAKTGLLVVKQEAQWVELYFRDGRLMCIGPVRPNSTLGDRLLQAGVISPTALQDALIAVGIVQPSETRLALTLMDLGHVSHEGLRSWATNEASGVIQVLLKWQSGEIYFEDGTQPPADRLLVSLSPAALLAPPAGAASSATKIQPQPQKPQILPTETSLFIEQQPQQVSYPAHQAPMSASQFLQAQMSASRLLAEMPAIRMSRRQLLVETPAIRMSRRQLLQAQISANLMLQALLSRRQLLTETLASPISFADSASPIPVMNVQGSADVQSSTSLTPPQRVNMSLPSIRIDTSFMHPEMVLLPVDLSTLRQQNPRLAITPEQWRILTRVDGQTSLQTMCMDLSIPAEYVCQLAGELIALGLIRLFMPIQPSQVQESEYSSVSLKNFDQNEQEPQQADHHEKSPAALFAIARTSLENNNKAYVDKVYTIETGISLGNAENLRGQWSTLVVSNINNPVQFDIVIHTSENIALITDWHGHLIYDPHNLEPQFINFKFSVINKGPSSITIDFYYQLQWLKTVRLEFESVAKPQLTAVVS